MGEKFGIAISLVPASYVDDSESGPSFAMSPAAHRLKKYTHVGRRRGQQIVNTQMIFGKLQVELSIESLI
jgi:hypothetical protein